jgi:hypothetical protein
MCVLHVTSKHDDFGPFLAQTSLPVYQSHRLGEIPKSGNRRPYEAYGFSCTVSERDFNDVGGQIEDALAFLTLHHSELDRLSKQYRVDDLRLDFPYWCRLDNTCFMQSDYLPAALLLAAGRLGIGIELSLYSRTDFKA